MKYVITLEGGTVTVSPLPPEGPHLLFLAAAAELLDCTPPDLLVGATRDVLVIRVGPHKVYPS